MQAGCAGVLSSSSEVKGPMSASAHLHSTASGITQSLFQKALASATSESQRSMLQAVHNSGFWPRELNKSTLARADATRKKEHDLAAN